MIRSISAVLLSLCCLLLTACKEKPSAPQAGTSSPAGDSTKPGNAEGRNRNGRAQTVTTTRSRTETVPLVLQAQGNVIALDEVDLRPQKNGMITAIHFKEGDELRRGQLLFTLDSRDDAANVSKATAGVISAEAAFSIAERDLKRSQELSDKNFIAPSLLDTSRSKTDTAQANLAQARAVLDQAKVSESYTHIRAPFDGRAGLINVRIGSLVTSTATSTSLVKLTRMNPIGVTFSLPERDLPTLLKAMQKGPVKLTALSAANDSLSGEVIFVDNNVDRVSGTILIKGKLDNRQRLAWPGQYVAVKLEAGTLSEATVLPAQAVLNGPTGRLVYVVQEDSSVEAVPVELLRILNEKAIVKGLPAGLKVVLEGGQNLRPGSKVSEAKANSKGDWRGKPGETTSSAPSAREAASSKEAPASSPKSKATGGSSSTQKPAETPAASTGGVSLPEGFTPRDPERWATASDEQKQIIITRWRERQAAKAAGADAP